MTKIIIVTAPSGAGKTTIVKHLINYIDQLEFSVSATTRSKRINEVNGQHYYFLSKKEFKKRIKANKFLEYEEVYKNQYYGTLKSEVERIFALGKRIIFDIDVMGAKNIKKNYPLNSLAIFIIPPSKEILFERLRKRNTETAESLEKRIAQASFELEFQNDFDVVLMNDQLEKTLVEAEELVRKFLLE